MTSPCNELDDRVGIGVEDCKPEVTDSNCISTALLDTMSGDTVMAEGSRVEEEECGNEEVEGRSTLALEDGVEGNGKTARLEGKLNGRVDTMVAKLPDSSSGSGRRISVDGGLIDCEGVRSDVKSSPVNFEVEDG